MLLDVSGARFSQTISQHDDCEHADTVAAKCDRDFSASARTLVSIRILKAVADRAQIEDPQFDLPSPRRVAAVDLGQGGALYAWTRTR
jgi:hypothetical protein